VLAGQRREAVRLGAGLRFAGPAASHPLRAPRRLVLALLALGCAFSLLAPSHSSAYGLVVRDAPWVGSQRPNHALHNQGPPRSNAAAPSQPDAPPRAEGGSLPVLLILALNSAVLLIRLVSSPPGWIKD
jgi:hypothetical protein